MVFLGSPGCHQQIVVPEYASGAQAGFDLGGVVVRDRLVVGEVMIPASEVTVALVQEQMRDLSVMQQKQAALTGTGTAAEGMVVVSVDARRMVIETVIADCYLEDFEFVDISGHFTVAARAAVQDIELRSQALLAPLSERRQEVSSLSAQVVEVPEFGELMARLRSLGAAPPGRDGGRGEEGGDGVQGSSLYPVVRT